MTVLATATIAGPEARGQAQLIQGDDGTATLEINQLWVAPGAPDVRLYVTPDRAGNVDQTATDLGPVPDQQPTLSRRLPNHLDPAEMVSVIVYCKVYSVRFGHGTFTGQEQASRNR
jgi:hypothetical protein